MPKTVADIMTRDPIAVTPNTTLKEAVQILADRRISGLPVIDDSGKLVGILSDTDLMWQESGIDLPPYIAILDSVIYLTNPMQFERELHKSLGQTVGEVMTERVKTVKPETALQEATRHLHTGGVHRLPVVDGSGKVVGILTRGDVVRAMAAGLA